jgi:hypothetical protein
MTGATHTTTTIPHIGKSLTFTSRDDSASGKSCEDYEFRREDESGNPMANGNAGGEDRRMDWDFAVVRETLVRRMRGRESRKYSVNRAEFITNCGLGSWERERKINLVREMVSEFTHQNW